ncbi:sensor histidine kinase [Nonomuraea sp. B12E4]|uniref:sensor histidine kinase n=1 Tax=Nonomuraea sp. B12E4 TaxID=3153564 RepID=UPI00325ED719
MTHMISWLRLMGQAFTLTGLAVATAVVLHVIAFSVIFIPVWIGIPMFVASVLWLRALANEHRRVAGRLLREEIPAPYAPLPDRPTARLTTVLGDPATWRDFGWVLANSFAGVALLAVPVGAFLAGVWYLLYPLLFALAPAGSISGHLFFETNTQLASFVTLPIGVACMALSRWLAPRVLGTYGRLTRNLLAPSERSQLQARVQQLTVSRADSNDLQATELRRIERDLHDGAQARLVAMGMTLGAADKLVEQNPAAARALLNEARDASARALNEIRDLVRGIHPPVLADRGLGDAVRALVLDTRFRAEVSVELSHRLPAPVESAAYFAVSEAVANAAKHSGAQRIWIDISHAGGRLRIVVTDDGTGGADLSAGSGLRGIERRLGAFDGVLALNSPPGGPTMVTMEIPCALSSQKISSS